MIRKIGYYCRKVLPTVLDDALSYYEQLCKVVLKCNEVIEVVNGVVESVDTLGERVENTEGDLNNLRGSVEDLDRGLRIVDDVATRITPLAENALQKTRSTNALYGTDATGEQKEYSVANGPNGFTVGLRDAGGVMRVGTPVGDYDAVNLKYFRENVGGNDAEMYAKKTRISSPVGDAHVLVSVDKLNGIVDDTVVEIFYHMPAGEWHGQPTLEVCVGGTGIGYEQIGGIPGYANPSLLTTTQPLYIRGWYSNGKLHMYYIDSGNTRIASGTVIDILGSPSVVTGFAYADVTYYKEG